MAQELGISESQARSGAAALLPAILGGFKKQAQTQPAVPQDWEACSRSLAAAVSSTTSSRRKPTNVNRVNDVLGQIFGSKDVSRTVAKSASGQSGLDPALLKKMLPMLAMLVAGYMAKKSAGGNAQAGGGGLLGGLLGGMLGGGASQGGGAKAGGLGSMLDLDGDGNPLDDILAMARKGLG